MTFDLGAFIRYNYRALFKTRGKNYQLTLKRFIVLLTWLILYIPAQLINRLFFLIDEILYPSYRKQEIRQPVFIIGNPRSGTTFLHRLMFNDTRSFTAFTVWEMVLAPSITQRKIIWALVKIGKAIGYPINQVINSINQHLTHGEGHKAHAIRVNEAEEDGHILIHNWTTESLWAIYPFRDELLPYFFFDRDLPKDRQQKVMKFYRNMIQRHLYAHGGDKILLSKNPANTSKIAAITDAFPGARFVNLVRTPFKAMPSMVDYMSTGWKIFCDPLEPYPFMDEFFQVMRFYYLYPAEFFKDKEDQCMFMKYDDLVQQPDECIEDLYDWLGLNYSPEMQKIVSRETRKAQSFRSRHDYSVDKMGLSEERIFSEFEEVFRFYEFDNHHIELPDHVMFWDIQQWPQSWKKQRLERQQQRQLRRLQKKTQSGLNFINPLLSQQVKNTSTK
jgi:hypothetical protein